jgi:hypothetical protein
MMGLDLQELDGWKPVYDKEIKVAKWDNGDYMVAIVLRLVSDKLDSVDDLKAAAPMMMQLGTAIDAVEKNEKTAHGWYAVVKRGKSTDMIYVRKFGKKTLVCSANVAPQDLGETLKLETAIKLAESIKVKG